MARRKKIVYKQLQCSTLGVQYAETKIEERSTPEKEIWSTINTYIKKGYTKKLTNQKASTMPSCVY